MKNNNNTPSTDAAIEKFHSQMFKTIDRLKEGNYDNLVDMLTLDEDYDNPDAVLQSSDSIAMLYAYYATLFHKANKVLQEYETFYKMKRSAIDDKIKLKLFNSNVDKGMTANNAKSTASDVENYFNIHYADKGSFLNIQKKIDTKREQVSQLRIMRDTIDRRQQSVQVISSLLGKCIDRGLITPKLGKTKSRKYRRRPSK